MGGLSQFLNTIMYVEAHDIPAPGPIEQRWTAPSRSPMSPAFSAGENVLFSWVGIIMYRGFGNAEKIDAYFDERYAREHLHMTGRYGGTVHWAKLPRFGTGAGGGQTNVELGRLLVQRRFGDRLARFDELRQQYDPDRLLGPAPWEPAGAQRVNE